jgi:hypothetical protein
MMEESQPTVHAAANAGAPQRENKTYIISCANELVSRWITSNPPALMAFGDALDRQGYAEAKNPATATYLIKVDMGFGPRRRHTPSETPNSIRYKNVAAMIGEGRYAAILTEQDDSEGSILIGPNGEEIPTGGWKTMAEETQRRMKHEDVAYDTLILRAWDIADRTSLNVFAWEIIVQRPADYATPSPKHVGLLLQEATTRVDTGMADLPNAEEPSVLRQ